MMESQSISLVVMEPCGNPLPVTISLTATLTDLKMMLYDLTYIYPDEMVVSSPSPSPSSSFFLLLLPLPRLHLHLHFGLLCQLSKGGVVLFEDKLSLAELGLSQGELLNLSVIRCCVQCALCSL